MLHGRTIGNEMIHRVLIALAFRLIREALTQRQEFKRPIDNLIEAFQIDGLDHKVVRAQLHRFHGVLHRSVGGQHDNKGVRGFWL